MDTFIYWPARALVAVIQALPLRLVARLGRGMGGLAFLADRPLPPRDAAEFDDGVSAREKSPAEIQELARENFRRIGENYLCAIKTAAMTCGPIAAAR